MEPSSHTLEAVRYIHNLYSIKEVWIVDVEFHQPRDYLPVPYAIAIYDGKTSEPLLQTAVDYESAPLRNLEELFVQTSGQDVSMYKWYQESKTNGMSLAAIGHHLVQAGYSADTHCIIG